MSTFGQEIKRLRTEAGLTQIQLSERIGITQGAVAAIETGRNTSVSVDTLFALSDALGVGSDYWRPFLADVRTEAAKPAKPARKPKK